MNTTEQSESPRRVFRATPEDGVADAFFSKLRGIATEHRKAAQEAILAFDRLIEVMRHKTGQGYKLRALLYSAWNGKDASVSDVLCFDWEVRKDLLAVLLGFGFEDKQVKFFYGEMEDQLKAAGLFEWFLEQSEDIK